MNALLSGLGGRPLRGLIGARVSVYKGEHKTSNIAQTDTGTRWATSNDVFIVATFEDLDVSAIKVSPFNRPDLKVWLAEDRHHEWDVLIFNKIDRVFRSTDDCVQFAKWMKDRKKILVFVDDGLVLNYLKPPGEIEAMMAEFFVLIGSFFAQIEGNRFRTRALDAHSVMRFTERWAGGIPPEGFKTAPHPGGEGRVLVRDRVRRKMMHRVAGWLMAEGETFNGAMHRLNEEGVETARDYHRPPEKKEGLKWSAGQVIDMLTGPATQGIKMTGRGRKARPLLDRAGQMIQMAEATFEPDVWEQLQEACAARRNQPRSRVNGANPLLDVAFCGLCDHKAVHRGTHHEYGSYRYYNCGNPHSKCSGVNARAAEVEELLEQEFLVQCGAESVVRLEFVPGSDHTAELAQVRKSINSLRDDRDLGLFEGELDEQEYRDRMSGLVARRNELAALPVTPAGWRSVETSQTYRQAWEAATPATAEDGSVDRVEWNDCMQRRRKMLVDAGVRFILKGKNHWEVQIPENIRGRLQTAM